MVRRKARLDEIPHARLIRGVILVRTADAEREAKFLQHRGARSTARTVALAEEDRERLGL